jgi:SH3-like domain-containing protein
MQISLTLRLGIWLSLCCAVPTLPIQAATKPANTANAPDHKSAVTAAPAVAPPQPAPIAPPAEAAPSAPAAHFASLRADKVNLHTGPGDDYPIAWQYIRRGMPVEVLTVFDIWRKIRDVDGAEGWVNQVMLTGRRSVLVTGVTRSLRDNPAADAAIVAQLEPGVIAKLSRCDPAWCQVEAQSYKGWLKREEIWGLEPGEVVQ